MRVLHVTQEEIITLKELVDNIVNTDPTVYNTNGGKS